MEDRYLFKAKRLDNGEWVQGYLYGIWEKRYILWGMTNDVPNMIEVDPSTICKCTVLKDKNGKLIWENDIVRDEYGNFYKAFWQNDYYQFSFCAETGVFPIGAKWNLWSFKSSEIEVVGNIFDNKESLESEENVEKCYCKTNDYLTIRRDVIGYGRSLVVGIDFKKKAITTYYAYACDSGTSKNLNIEYCPLCGEKD